MLESDPIARDLIAKALGKAADKAVREHIVGITQEAPITARIGQTMEDALDGKEVLGHRVRVVTQDIPDRGPGALEKDIGADLYVGIEVISGRKRQTKGFLVQAKIGSRLTRSAGYDSLEADCADMIARSEASYVWLYEKKGIRVLNAQKVVGRGSTPPELRQCGPSGHS